MYFKVHMTNEQYITVKLKAQVLGYSSIAQFVRDRLLHNNLDMEKKVKAIHKKLVKHGNEQSNKDICNSIPKPTDHGQG